MRSEQAARRMFERKATSYGVEPAMTQIAWADDAIRELWLGKARAAIGDTDDVGGA